MSDESILPTSPLGCSAQVDQIFDALAEAQGMVANPDKNRTVKVKSDKGDYSYGYATLDAVLEIIRPANKAHGLSLFQRVIGPSPENEFELETVLGHKSGQWISSRCPLLIDKAGNQGFGIARTYARRYSLVELYAIAAEEDTDARLSEFDDSPDARADRRGAARARRAQGGGQAPPPARPAAPAAKASQAPPAAKAPNVLALRTAEQKRAEGDDGESTQAQRNQIRELAKALGIGVNVNEKGPDGVEAPRAAVSLMPEQAAAIGHPGVDHVLIYRLRQSAAARLIPILETAVAENDLQGAFTK